MLHLVSALYFWSIVFVVVSLHVAGHFVVAKLLGVRVSWCSVGFGRTLYSREIGETTYFLKVLPVWCRVRVDGDTARVVVQSAVILAGPLCSLLSAWFIAFSIFMVQGVGKESRGPTEIKGFDRLSLHVTPEKIPDSAPPMLGSSNEGHRLGIERTPFPVETARFNARLSAEGAIMLCQSTLTLLKGLIIPRNQPENLQAISGVVRLAKQPPELGIFTRILVVWMFGLFAPSFLLGIINLLPLPFLDGGRLVKAILRRFL